MMNCLPCDLDDQDIVTELNTNGVAVSQGSAIMVTARTNPTTGYDWMVDLESCDGVVDIDQTYMMDDPDSTMMGQGGTTVFTLVGL